MQAVEGQPLWGERHRPDETVHGRVSGVRDGEVTIPIDPKFTAAVAERLKNGAWRMPAGKTISFKFAL